MLPGCHGIVVVFGEGVAEKKNKETEFVIETPYNLNATFNAATS